MFVGVTASAVDVAKSDAVTVQLLDRPDPRGPSPSYTVTTPLPSPSVATVPATPPPWTTEPADS